MSGPGQHVAARSRANAGTAPSPVVERVGGGQVDDQRMAGGTSLHREDAAHGGRLLGVGAEPVDRLGGEHRQPARGEAVGGPLRIVGQQLGH